MCIGLLSWFMVSAQAQNSVPALTRKAAQEKVDSLRLEAITQLFWEYSLSDPHRADSLVQVEMNLANQIHSPYWISMAWNDKAILAIRKSAFPEAIEFLNQSLQIRLRLNNPELLASTYSKLGNVYAQTNQNEKALGYLFRSLRFYENLGRKNEAGIILSAIAASFVNLKDPRKAMGYLQKAARLHKEMGDEYSYHVVQANLANAWLDLHQADKALPLLKACETGFQKAGDLAGLANVWGSMGLAFRQKGDHQTGLGFYRKSFHQTRILGDTMGQAMFAHNLGSVWKDLGQMDSARHYLAIALRLSDALQLAEYQKMVAQSLLELELISRPGALPIWKKYLASSDTLLRQQNVRFAQEMDVKYSTELRESRIRQLSVQNRLRQAEIREKEQRLRNSRFLLALSGLAGLLVLLSAFFYVSRLRIRNQLELSRLKEEEQQKALRSVIEAQEKERALIAAELHDSIGQQLGALRFRISAQPEASELLLQSMTELRQISHRMMPLTLTRFGLVPALEELFSQTLPPAGIQYQFDTVGNFQHLPEPIGLSLYRICQELVQNTIRHSGATTLEVLLQKAGTQLILRFEDNGVGLPPHSQPDGMGLQNIRTRLQPYNGVLIQENRMEGGLRQVVRVENEEISG